MMYQIEEIKTEKRKLNYKKLVICILILLLVLYVSIRLGMTAAQKSQEGSLASVQEQSDHFAGRAHRGAGRHRGKRYLQSVSGADGGTYFRLYLPQTGLYRILRQNYSA